MTTEFPQVVPPIEKHHIDDISQLNRAMTDNPQAVMDYVTSLHKDRHKLNEIEKKEARTREQSRALKEQDKERDRKRRVSESLPAISNILLVAAIMFGQSSCFVLLFSSIPYGILPWSPQFQFIAKALAYPLRVLSGPVHHRMVTRLVMVKALSHRRSKGYLETRHQQACR